MLNCRTAGKHESDSSWSMTLRASLISSALRSNRSWSCRSADAARSSMPLSFVRNSLLRCAVSFSCRRDRNASRTSFFMRRFRTGPAQFATYAG
eukprot:5826027-Pyramimonas_sp.AAC.1